MIKNRSYTEEEFKNAVKQAFSIASALRLLGLSPTGANYRGFKILVKEIGVDYSHFTGQAHLRNKTHDWGKKQYTTEQILVKNSPYVNTNSMKRRLIKEGLLENKCSICGITTWQNEKIVCHLDHINGVNDDNRIENLRMLCPNCHSQTDTWTGRNKSYKRKDNHCIDCGTKVRYESTRCVECSNKARKGVPFDRRKRSSKKALKSKLCPDCSKEIKNSSTRCSSCRGTNNEKIQWPSDEELAKLVWEKPRTQLSKELGVSDRAISKRLKKRGIAQPPRGYWAKKKAGKI